MLNCRWCQRPVDLPSGDECAECQERLNRRFFRRPKHVADARTVAAYFRGCELVMKEDGRPVTKVAFDYRAVPTRDEVVMQISIFFSHPERISIERVRGAKQKLFSPKERLL